MNALNHGVKIKDITKAIKLNDGNAKGVLSALESLIRRVVDKPVVLKPQTSELQSATQQAASSVTKNVLLTPIITGKWPSGMQPGSPFNTFGNAEGGVHYSPKNRGGTMAAASGYTKDTARGKAGSRPVRKAMGRFNEPTLLVGEENIPEFVIATNPAYRSQNKRYLAAAAAALGMSVNDGPLTAASGYAPSIIRDAIFSATTTDASIKRDAKRIKALKNKIKRYDAQKKHSAAAQVNHRFDLQELHSLQHATDKKKHAKKVGAEAANLKRFEDLASKASTDMEIANKRGDARAFSSAKNTRRKYLLAEQAEYKRALSGADVNQRAALSNKISELTKDILDNRDNLYSPAGRTESQQAIIDRQNAIITSQKNEIAIQSAFGSTVGGMFYDSESIAAGGPGGASYFSGRGARTANPIVVNINTLHPGDPSTLSAVASAATGGLDLQGTVTSPRSLVG